MPSVAMRMCIARNLSYKARRAEIRGRRTRSREEFLEGPASPFPPATVPGGGLLARGNAVSSPGGFRGGSPKKMYFGRTKSPETRLVTLVAANAPSILDSWGSYRPKCPLATHMVMRSFSPSVVDRNVQKGKQSPIFALLE